MKVLVVGGAGMLGHQCFIKLRNVFGTENVGCTLRKKSEHYSRFAIFNTGPVFDQLDVASSSDLEKCLNSFKPTVIVNCVGLTLRKPELGDFEKALEINSMLPHRLALWGLTNNARVIHFSTDCVFSGSKGNYTELSNPDAGDVYGKTKFLGEIQYANSLTMRLSIVGRELEGKTELIEWFLSQKGKPTKGYAEVMYSGLTTNTVADEVIKVIRDFPSLNGVFQISSLPISKFDLLKLVNNVYGNKSEITPDSNYKANKVLDCKRYQSATGFQVPDWSSMIQKMKKEESIDYAK